MLDELPLLAWGSSMSRSCVERASGIILIAILVTAGSSIELDQARCSNDRPADPLKRLEKHCKIIIILS